jgi:hypothetical protein
MWGHYAEIGAILVGTVLVTLVLVTVVVAAVVVADSHSRITIRLERTAERSWS